MTVPANFDPNAKFRMQVNDVTVEAVARPRQRDYALYQNKSLITTSRNFAQLCDVGVAICTGLVREQS